MMNKQERQNRIIARGEASNHAHVVTGDAKITRNNSGEILIELGKEECVLRHILETAWLEGTEVHTQEHGDINLTEIDKLAEVGTLPARQGDVALEKIAKGKYRYVPQVEFDPYDAVIRKVQD